jgi:hypothetical protein
MIQLFGSVCLAGLASAECEIPKNAWNIGWEAFNGCGCGGIQVGVTAGIVKAS